MSREAKSLDKGAIPRITQEVYFTVRKDGKTQLNAELTIAEFFEKLDEIKKCYDIFENIDRAIEEEFNK